MVFEVGMALSVSGGIGGLPLMSPFDQAVPSKRGAMLAAPHARRGTHPEGASLALAGLHPLA